MDGPEGGAVLHTAGLALSQHALVDPGGIITGSIVFFIYTVPLASSDWHGGIASFASRPLQLATLPMAWPCWQEDIITLPATPCSWHDVTGLSCL